MVRWDSPLFTIPWTDESPPSEDIWKAVTEGFVKPPNVGTQSVGRRVSYVVSQLRLYLRYRKRPRTRSIYWSRLQPQWFLLSWHTNLLLKGCLLEDRLR